MRNGLIRRSGSVPSETLLFGVFVFVFFVGMTLASSPVKSITSARVEEAAARGARFLRTGLMGTPSGSSSSAKARFFEDFVGKPLEVNIAARTIKRGKDVELAAFRRRKEERVQSGDGE